MAKKPKPLHVDSDGSEGMLVELVGRFSIKRAVEWLRIKFPSFDTSRAEELACDTTKNEKDYFVSAELLGYVTRLPLSKSDDANKPVLVAAIKMRKDLTERTSRLVQFNYAKKLLQNAIAKGAQGVSGLPSQGLFFFYDKDGFFRLSLVTGEVEKRRFKYNEAKRQSFYIEPQAANNIVKRRLTPPIKTFAELKDVFSVEQLTKEFYSKLFDWYTWAMSAEANVSFPNDLEDDKDDRKYNNEAIIRMITRLMFTWFIRQRKLVPDVLFERDGLQEVLKNFEPDSMEQGNYYRAILQNLFFATFNCPQSGKGKLTRRWIDADVNASGNGVGLSRDYRVTTVYRYRNEFKKPDEFLEMMRRVPFLNCALFDCLDKIEREVDGGRKLYFDGFSTKKARQAHVPNGLFFDSERGIINLFNLYEFTVNENNADDSDVALDPELLGKVFENLLGAFNPETQETARNATGSFYTPREIVDYMVEESLRNYLKTKVPEADDARLDDLFDRNKAAEGADTLFSSKEREAILSALYGCKILDPACGSGAFPMGVLHCMVRLLTRLDPQCISIREHLLSRYRADKASIDPTETEDERKERLAELESRLKEGQHYPDYERKLYLIENCIYGVDIQPIATQISKLRFFISLLCDQLRSSYDPDAENFGLLSLPNLEAKFVCANTLISLPNLEDELAYGDKVVELRVALQENRHKIFRARSTKTKDKYKRRDLEIRDAIRDTVRDSLSKPDADVIAQFQKMVADAKNRRLAVAEPDWHEETVQVQGDLFSPVEFKRVRKDRNEPKRSAIDSEIRWAEDKIKKELAKADRANVSSAARYADMVAGWDPYDQNASSSFFDPEWMFNIKDGFDVVIGNPPYVKLETIREASRLYEAQGYETFSRRGDLYVLFTERGFQFLAGSGWLCYIMSNKWLQAEYGRHLRRYFLEKRLDRIVDFGDIQIFSGATTYPCIFLASKGMPVKDVQAVYLRSYRPESFAEDVAAWSAPCPVSRLSEDAWVLNLVEKDLLDKLKNGCLTLNEKIGGGAYYGIKPGATEAFIINADTRSRIIKEDPASAEIILPMLRGRDIAPFFARTGLAYLIGTHNGYGNTPPVDVNDYRGVKHWLDGFHQQLVSRSDQGKTPYNLRDCAYWRLFKQPKIMYQKFQTRSCFIYDEEGLFCNDSMWVIPTEEKWLVGVLNSKMGWWLISKYCTQIQNGYQLIWEYLGKIPMPLCSQSEPCKTISALVDRIQATKKADPAADTSALEAEIDQLVYKLYGLTDEEIAVVEGRGESNVKSEEPRTVRASTTRRNVTVTETPTDDEELE